LCRIDVGRAECARDDFYFLNIIGAGLPVEAMRAADRLKPLGAAAYSVAAFWRAIVLKSYRLIIEINKESIEEDALFVEVSNTRYTGTSFLMAPAARFDDGLFDVTLVRRLPRGRLLRLFPTIYSGRHVEFDEVTTLQTDQVCIRAPAGLPLAADGEFRGETPVTIRCLPRELEIYC
jgi:diacylglycerol kinase (ATP)